MGIFLHYDSVGNTGTLLRNVLPTLISMNPEDGGSKFTRNVFVILQGTWLYMPEDSISNNHPREKLETQ